jgi:chromosome segregation ATPase
MLVFSQKFTDIEARFVLAHFRASLYLLHMHPASELQSPYQRLYQSGATEASKKALSGNVEQLNRLVEAAKNEAATVGMSSREKAKYVANLLGATEAERQSIDASYDKIEAYQAEQKAQKEKESEDKKAAAAATSAAKKSEAEQQQVINQLDQLANKYQIATLQQQGMGREAAILAAQQQLGAAATQQQVQQAGELAGKMYDLAEATKSAKEEEQKRKESSQNFTQLQGQASPVAAVDNTYAQQMAQLNQYVQLYPQKIAEAEAVRAQIEDQYHPYEIKTGRLTAFR